jgi:hypothetical protein
METLTQSGTSASQIYWKMILLTSGAFIVMKRKQEERINETLSI